MTSEQQPTFAEERRQQIAEAVARQGRVRLADLVKLHGVTEPTIRKDLDELQRRRLLRRTHGGAIAVEQHLEEPLGDRTSRNREAKEAIADLVMNHIRPGAAVFLDSGSTLEVIAERLDVRNINILTNAVQVARLVADRPHVRHTLTGGQIRSLGGTLVGPIALETLSRFTVDVAVISASGITEEGISVADVAEAQIKRAIIDRARTVLLAADSSKFGTSDFVEVCALNRINTIATEKASAEVTAWCERSGVSLETAIGH